MKLSSLIQLRGNCQCCGRQQAVLASGRMAKHGYTVEQGWFSGVCPGQHYSPMQRDRTQTDAVVAKILDEAAALLLQAEGLRSGLIKPTMASTGRMVQSQTKRGWEVEKVAFYQASPHYQKEAITSAIYAAESRARHGKEFAHGLRELADKCHGQPLIEHVRGQF